jgi:prefoldin subunit 5
MKIERINEEIGRTKEKISGLQSHLRDLERKKTEAENTEIIATVRSAELSQQELLAFIRAYRAQGVSAETMFTGHQPAQEEIEDDED